MHLNKQTNLLLYLRNNLQTLIFQANGQLLPLSHQCSHVDRKLKLDENMGNTMMHSQEAQIQPTYPLSMLSISIAA